MSKVPSAFTGAQFFAANGFALEELEGCLVVPRIGEIVWLRSNPDRDVEYPDDHDFEAEGFRWRVIGVEWTYHRGTSLGQQHLAHVVVEPVDDAEVSIFDRRAELEAKIDAQRAAVAS